MIKGNLTTATPTGYEQIKQRVFSAHTVYFEDTFEKAVFKYVHVTPRKPLSLGQFFVKFRGRLEFPIAFESDLILQAMFEGQVITKKRYENF